MNRLITIPISHYCERARWALDRSSIRYEESQHLQFFASLHAKRAGGRRTVPVLTCEDGTVLNDSGTIALYAHDHGASLFPNGASKSAIVELSDAWAGAFGICTRLVAYEWFFRVLRQALPINAASAPRYEALTLWALQGPARVGASLAFRRSERRVESAKRRVRTEFDRAAELLRDGRPFLFGDAFSLADLTFAALAYPAILPEHFPLTLPTLDQLPPDARRDIEEFRAHPAGRYVARLYETERRRPKAPSTPA